MDSGEATSIGSRRSRRASSKASASAVPELQPTFWHKAANSAATTKTFFTKLRGEEATYFLVAVEGSQGPGPS